MFYPVSLFNRFVLCICFFCVSRFHFVIFAPRICYSLSICSTIVILNKKNTLNTNQMLCIDISFIKKSESPSNWYVSNVELNLVSAHVIWWLMFQSCWLAIFFPFYSQISKPNSGYVLRVFMIIIIIIGVARSFRCYKLPIILSSFFITISVENKNRLNIKQEDEQDQR